MTPTNPNPATFTAAIPEKPSRPATPPSPFKRRPFNRRRTPARFVATSHPDCCPRCSLHAPVYFTQDARQHCECAGCGHVYLAAPQGVRR
jgi:hypothetical protein